MHIVLIYSGGIDSTTLLYYLRDAGHQVSPLGIHYGQRHAKELRAAQDICEQLDILYPVADLSGLRPILKGSSQTDASVEVPEGHYADASMRLTVVPNRNMIMLAVAGAYAISNGADAVAYGPHAGDHPIYADCRNEFATAMNQAFELCNEPGLILLTPFLLWTKADIVKCGAELGVPFEKTWSCYKGLDLHCGKCGTCYERREAFIKAGVDDPTEYEN